MYPIPHVGVGGGTCLNTHIKFSKPCPEWIFVSLISWHILINRTVFLCKRNNVWDAQSFNVGNFIILTSFHATYYKMEGHTYKFISADDVPKKISVGLLNRRKIYVSWDGQFLVNLWLGCSFERQMFDVESVFLLFFHLIMIIWIFFPFCIVSIHNFWCQMFDWWIRESVDWWVGFQNIWWSNLYFILKKINYWFWILKIRLLE